MDWADAFWVAVRAFKKAVTLFLALACASLTIGMFCGTVVWSYRVVSGILPLCR